MQYALVALYAHALPNEAFTYHIPEHLLEKVTIGMSVLVPFLKKTLPGIILGFSESTPAFTTKPIQEILHPTPLLNKVQIQIIHKIQSYYYAPINKCARLFLPQKIWTNTFQYKKTTAICLDRKDYTPSPRASKEKELLELLLSKPDHSIAEQEARDLGHPLSAWKKLIEKKIVSLKKTTPFIPTPSPHAHLRNPHPLSEAQEQIKNTIQTNPDNKYLLHGVTGSGKTEIYVHLAKEQVAKNKQTIMLVPEISLTPQLTDYFQQVFGDKVALLHSKLNDTERCQEWWRIYHGDAEVIIGSRSALFSPTHRLGLIILDEEHEWSYKSDQSPRYHTKTVAEWIQEITKATLLLGSATPSIETYYQSQIGKYSLLELQEKFYSH